MLIWSRVNLTVSKSLRRPHVALATMHRSRVDTLLRLTETGEMLHHRGYVAALQALGVVVSELAGEVGILGETFLDLAEVRTVPRLYTRVYIHGRIEAHGPDRQPGQRAG